MEKALKIIGIAFAVLSVLLGAWMLISYIDIISHNVESFEGYGEYLSWNFFTVLEKLVRG